MRGTAYKTCLLAFSDAFQCGIGGSWVLVMVGAVVLYAAVWLALNGGNDGRSPPIVGAIGLSFPVGGMLHGLLG